ncbi:MAG: nuclear transport factor 2 family protein [Novosphingobium sp.]|nr:nuclear transport factor 2 family protein [Novosphingobium sp.]
MTNAGMSPAQIIEDCNRLIMENRAMEAVEKYVAEDFIEHNPIVRGGNREGFIEHLVAGGFTNPDNPRMKMTVDRVIEQNEMVVTHIHVDMPDGPTLVFMDIYRVENGKMVEHWDVMQPVPETSVNGRVTMY